MTKKREDESHRVGENIWCLYEAREIHTYIYSHIGDMHM